MEQQPESLLAPAAVAEQVIETVLESVQEASASESGPAAVAEPVQEPAQADAESVRHVTDAVVAGSSDQVRTTRSGISVATESIAARL